MKIVKYSMVFLLFCSILPSFAQDWKLVWSDEFDYKGLPDPAKWNYESGYVRNQEKQYYTKHRLKNARVEDGFLVIEAHKEPFKDMEYTSASINTRYTQSWTYGRFEIRAKLPTGKGTWPAIWMLGTNLTYVGWPSCGEIDIMENVGYAPENIHANVHTKTNNHTIGTGKGNRKEYTTPYDQFYTYALEWTPEKLVFFVDDDTLFTYENDRKGDWKTWPFDKPQYLLLNLAIGGAWGGREGIDDSIFPQKYYIDYVRVYQQDK